MRAPKLRRTAPFSSIAREGQVRLIDKVKKVVVCAVGSEPVSRDKFPVTPKKQGNFGKLCGSRCAFPLENGGFNGLLATTWHIGTGNL
jgi:hypothetical protein